MCGDQGECEKGDKRGRLDYATDKIMMMATTHPAITLQHESSTFRKEFSLSWEEQEVN